MYSVIFLLWIVAVLAIMIWLIRQPQLGREPVGVCTWTVCGVPEIRADVELPPQRRSAEFRRLTAQQQTRLIDQRVKN